MYLSIRVEFISFYFLGHRDMEKEFVFLISTKKLVPYVDLSSNPHLVAIQALRRQSFMPVAHTREASGPKGDH